MICNILDFGAVADGRTMNTEAINKAVKACAAAGGGQVIVPAGGVFVSGTIWLKSHVELHLEKGSVLKASGNFADYNANDAYPQNYFSRREEWNGAHFILAVEQEDIAITGSGTIDGSGDAFVSAADDIYARNLSLDYSRVYSWHVYCWFKGFRRAFRPGQLICIVECSHVKMYDFNMVNQPSWGLFLFGCDDVQVRGLTITNPGDMGNTDGMDIDACHNVTVSDCIIDTGDDAIAIRSYGHRLKSRTHDICEYVTITNCVLSSCSSVFRVGVGHGGELRHIRVSNIVVHHGSCLVNCCTEYGETDYTPMSDINFSNISATNIANPICIRSNKGTKASHITLENIRSEARGASWIVSGDPGVFEDIVLKNVDIFMINEPADEDAQVRAFRGEYAFVCENADDVELDHVRIFADDKVRAKWTGLFRKDNCPGLIEKDCRF